MAPTTTDLRIIGTPPKTWRQDRDVLFKVRDRTKHCYVAITTEEDGDDECRAVGATSDDVLNLMIPLLVGYTYHIYLFTDDRNAVRCVHTTRKFKPVEV